MSYRNRFPLTAGVLLSTLMTLLSGGSETRAQASGSGTTTVFPGGFLELSSSGDIRPRPSLSQIQAFLPQRGAFTFPSPWLTQGVRLTNPGDCSGGDCVNYVGYSYWRNINNHVGSDTMLIFLGLNPARGGGGPTLFSYDKTTDAVTNLGPMFDVTSKFRGATAEGWYFSATRPTTIYLNDGAKMLRYDVLSRQFSTVFDAAPAYGSDKFIWQMHSSDDDRVHSATLVSATTSKMLGCLAYREDTAQLFYYPEVGSFDECHVDKSGRWLVILDNVDGLYGLDNRIIDLQTGAETLLLDQNGALGHLDTGDGYMVGEDDWAQLPGTVRLWKFGQGFVPGASQGVMVYHTTDWNVGAGHIAHGNARAGVAVDQQYTCSSTTSRLTLPRSNEIVCYRLDNSQDVLVVAPVMTDLDAAGGGDDYSKAPKGNLDVTGRYFVWTSNMGGGRLDAFIVKVPSHLLDTGASDTTPPTVSITSPLAGVSLSGASSVTAKAADDVGVAGVRLYLDGVALGSEMAAPPYSGTLDASVTLPGLHVLTAVARDAAGNTATSAPVQVSTLALTAGPAISSISVSSLTSFRASVVWTTDIASNSQVEYGLTTAYGSTTTLDASQVTSHSRTLAGLSGGTLYHFRVRSSDLLGRLSVSGDRTLTTVLDLDVGRMAHYRLDEKSGATALDSSGSGNSGTLMNGPAWTPGILQGGLSFDGTNDFVKVPHQVSLDVYPLSISMWVNSGAAGTRGLVNKYASGSQNGYQLFLKDGNVCASFFKSASRYVGDGTSCAVKSSALVNDSRWHHLAFVVSPAGGRLYVDGVVNDSRAWSGAPGIPTTSQDLWLGRHASSAAPYLSGTMDDVRLYNRALSQAEVTALFAAPSPVAPPPGSAVLEPVAWTSVVNCSVSGNSLQKTSGLDDVDDAGAVSQQQIVAGDGYVEFTAAETATLRLAGLSHGSSGTGYAEIDFAIRLQSGVAEVLENGAYRGETAFGPGDVFRVAIVSGRVVYSRQGVPFYTSATPPTYPLLMDATLVNLNGTIRSAMIFRTP